MQRRNTSSSLRTVAVAVELGDAGEALDIAAGVDPSHLSPERQARFLVDIARAHTQRRHIGDATDALLAAEKLPNTSADTTKPAKPSVTSSTSPTGDLHKNCGI